MAFAIAIFVGALALIASEKVNRTKVALAGAILVLVTQTIEQEKAIEAIDFNTIGLLVGMMLVVKLTEPTGVYTYVAIKAGQLSKGRPWAVVASLAIATAVLSAFLDNLTTVLLDGADHLPAGRRARHRPDPARADRDHRLEHRRHLDAHRRPAEHPHRGRDRPELRRLPRQPRPRGDRRLRGGDERPLLLLPLPAADRPRGARPRHGARRRPLDRGPGRAEAPAAGHGPHDRRLLRPPGAPHRARHRRAGRRDRDARSSRGSRSRRRSPASSGRRSSSSSASS